MSVEQLSGIIPEAVIKDQELTTTLESHIPKQDRDQEALRPDLEKQLSQEHQQLELTLRSLVAEAKRVGTKLDEAIDNEEDLEVISELITQNGRVIDRRGESYDRLFTIIDERRQHYRARVEKTKVEMMQGEAITGEPARQAIREFRRVTEEMGRLGELELSARAFDKRYERTTIQPQYFMALKGMKQEELQDYLDWLILERSEIAQKSVRMRDGENAPESSDIRGLMVDEAVNLDRRELALITESRLVVDAIQNKLKEN